MLKSHVAAVLAHHYVSDALMRTNQTMGGNTAREFHAASTEINSKGVLRRMEEISQRLA